jgi:hypothetical protein
MHMPDGIDPNPPVPFRSGAYQLNNAWRKAIGDQGRIYPPFTHIDARRILISLLVRRYQVKIGPISYHAEEIDFFHFKDILWHG